MEVLRAGEQRTVTLTADQLGCQLVVLGKDPPGLYSAACRLALDGQAETAMAVLARAVADGSHDVEWLTDDQDLVSLHAHPGWGEVVQAATAAQQAYFETVNRELYELYVADQAERSGEIDWSVLASNDRRRRERVLEMLAAGEVVAADDCFFAAMVLQHGENPEHYLQAHELARRSAELGPSAGLPARWLAAAARDRCLLSIGEKQIYGTQYRSGADGVVTLQPIDEDAVSDSERVAWDVPTLAETRARLAAMSGPTSGE